MLGFDSVKENGDHVYIAGLDRSDLDHLASGQPVLVNLAEMGGPPLELLILFNETERGLLDELKAVGALPPGEVHIVGVPLS